MAEVALAKGDDDGGFLGGIKAENINRLGLACLRFRADEERRVGERLSRRWLVYLDAIV